MLFCVVFCVMNLAIGLPIALPIAPVWIAIAYWPQVWSFYWSP